MTISVESKVVSAETAAVMLGVTKNHIYALCRANRLRHVRLGRRVVIPKEAVDDLLSGRVASSDTKPAA
jgi:excisionase family DNA binding protein